MGDVDVGGANVGGDNGPLDCVRGYRGIRRWTLTEIVNINSLMAIISIPCVRDNESRCQGWH